MFIHFVKFVAKQIITKYNIMKKISLILLSAILVSSCVSKKEFAALQTEKTQTEEELLAVKTTLQKCLIENENIFSLTEQIKSLKDDKKNALN